MPASKKPTSLRIVLLGSGNLATHLGLALKNKGYDIIQVYSRDLKHARLLAGKIKAEAINNLMLLDQNAGLYIIAVKDDAIQSIAAKLRLGNKLVVHTSGSVSSGVLDSSSTHTGVFYPLQTFTKSRPVNWLDIPVCIETKKKGDRKVLAVLASGLSRKVLFINSAQRLKLHLAAVIAANFSNHLYSISGRLLKKGRLNPHLLDSLILETTAKAIEMGPEKSQTGPAKRRDNKTMSAHLKLLSGKRDIISLYKTFSKNISGQ